MEESRELALDSFRFLPDTPQYCKLCQLPKRVKKSEIYLELCENVFMPDSCLSIYGPNALKRTLGRRHLCTDFAVGSS